MTEIAFGLFSGVALGLCVAPLWMMLQLPMRVADLFDVGSIRMTALALMIGAALAALNCSGFLPDFCGVIALGFGGMFVGMLSAALVEAVEVIPVLYDRLSISADMRPVALALAVGKAGGAVISALMGG